MGKGKEVKVGTVYRGLAALICMAAFGPFFFRPSETLEHYLTDYFALAGLLTLIPLFLYCAVCGKVPPLITDRLSDDALEDYTNVQTCFTQFNAKSIAAAVVALIIIFLVMYYYR